MRSSARFSVAGFILMAITINSSYASLPSLLPKPLGVKAGAGEGFEITSRTMIVCHPELKDTALQLLSYLKMAGVAEKNIVLAPDAQRAGNAPADGFKNAIDLRIDKAANPTTGSYSLEISPECIRITAGSAAGAFYGAQTLRQLLPAAIESPQSASVKVISAPPLAIRDHPSFEWRGLMLDCSRHFMDVPTIKRLLDAMAFMKMNRFHWHLIDSNGWRLQIDKYPLLTENGAWRGPANARYGGFYSKKDVREIVAYAASLHIAVIPEFEMPGHSDAAMMAYPHLSCLGSPYKLGDETRKDGEYDSLGWYTDLGPSRPFCAGNDESFRFIEDVFDEALELFPYPVWHVGGDERPEGQWAKCPACQARMKKHNMPDEHALQLWFMRRVSDILARKGKTCISWAISSGNRYYDPLDIDNLGNGAILMNWHGSTQFACKHDMKVVNAASESVYLDYPPFAMYPGWERPKWMAILGMEKMYGFDPVPPDLTPAQAKNVLGVETCVWTEFLPQDQLFAWIFPRVLAAAEIGWLPAANRKDFNEFQLRVLRLEERFARMGISFGHPTPDGNGGDHHRK